MFVAEKDNEVIYERNALRVGFVKIAPKDYFSFNTFGYNGRVYVSIIYYGELIADNYELENGKNIIVKEGGFLCRTKDGEIWVDTEGNCYP